MLLLGDTDAMNSYFLQHPDKDLSGEFLQRLSDLDEYGCDYGELLNVAVFAPEDRAEHAVPYLGFSALETRSTGHFYGSASFTPTWDEIIELKHWYGLLYIIRDDGFGLFLLIPKESTDHSLLSMLSEFSTSQRASI